AALSRVSEPQCHGVAIRAARPWICRRTEYDLGAPLWKRSAREHAPTCARAGGAQSGRHCRRRDVRYFGRVHRNADNSDRHDPSRRSGCGRVCAEHCKTWRQCNRTWNLVDDALMGKGLDFFKLAVPSLARVGALFNPDDPTDGVQIPRLPAAARAIGVTIEFIEVRNLSNLDAVTTRAMGANVQGVFVGIAPFWLSARTDITAMMARLKLPAMFSWREFTDAGGLMSYGCNLPDMYRTAARLVDRILKGAKPGDLPFEIPTRYELIVNLKTAKAMGLNISDSFLLLADEVIE